MFVGTQSDNMRDMAAKNRSTHGENHASAKLTNAKVLAIKAARARGVLLRVLAKRYKVSNMTISRIGTNQRWKHLLEKK
jgi:glycine cleavage system protein P-like pyridoxal-binding family